VPREHWDGFPAADGRPGGGAGALAAGRPRRVHGHRERAQLHDARAQVVDRPYPFASHYIDRGGIKLHYLDEGTGDPVVMLRDSRPGTSYSRTLVAALGARFRCVAPDHVGCGQWDKPQPPRYDYSLKSRVDDLAALLDHLGVRRDVTLVMHDWGG